MSSRSNDTEMLAITISTPNKQHTDSIEWDETYSDYYENDVKVDVWSPATITSFKSAQLPHLLSSAPDPPPYKPTVGVLFCLSSRKELLTLTLPGVVVSCGSAVIQPYITTVLGRAFDSFSDFVKARTDANGDQALLSAAKSHFRHEQLVLFATMLCLAAITVITCVISLMLWNTNAEYIVRKLRQKMYYEVTKKRLEWFDRGMGTSANSKDSEETEGSSAGLAGRFARDTDEVRLAAGQTFGLCLQSLVTGILCLILGFVRSWQLTLVIFITFPLVLIASAVIEKLANPLVQHERNYTAAGSTLVERAISAIPTVKAFNAEQEEESTFLNLARRTKKNYDKLTMLWGLRLGIAQFFLLASFLQGFWYGNKLVSQGKLSPGQVMEVFSAIMIASSSFQQIIPYLNMIEQGKIGMAGLLNLVREQAVEEARPPSPTGTSSTAALTPVNSLKKSKSTRARQPKKPSQPPRTRQRTLRKIQPSSFKGELSLHNVSFWYPTRPYPNPPVLDNVSLFLPAKEMTFVVGQSGSGKSTIGALLLGLYSAQYGSVEADEQGIEWLDDKWLRSHISLVSQQSVIFEGTVHENVAIGALDCKPEQVTRETVIEACRIALVHDFIRDLPDGYDTMLSGEKGASLSGGQRQRLAIARAYVRNPSVLILDEATSALDATSRLLVFEALKQWRQNATTIVITHDLNPIVSTDFVYVLKDGVVVEQGYRADLEADPDGWFSCMAGLQSSEANAPASPAEPPVFDITPPSPSVSRFEVEVEPGPAGRLSAQFNQLMDAKRRSSTLFFTSPADVREYMADQHSPASPSPKALTEQLFLSPSRSSSLPFISTRQPRFSMTVLDNSAKEVANRRVNNIRHRRVHPEEEKTKEEIALEMGEPALKPPSFFGTLFRLLPVVPNKLLLTVGFLICILAGVTTPTFSFLLSKMFTTLGTREGSSGLVRNGLLILAVAFVDGIAMWLKYSLLQRAAMGWVNSLRRQTYKRLLSQDKSFYDDPQHTGMRISNSTVKDVNDARNMIGMITGQLVIVVVMLMLGLIWALAVGWELTLVGCAVAPVMAIALGWQTSVLGKMELINKALRENITTQFHQVITNIKAIKSMSIEPVFDHKFEEALAIAHKTHRKTAFFSGTAYSVGQCMNIVAEGILLFVASIFVASERYTFGQMLQVFSLIMLSVSFGSQTLSYVPSVSRAAAAAYDLLKLYELREDTEESRGKEVYPITGHITFTNVDFAYPSRKDVKALDGLSLSITAGECIGIVGGSGSGKSTIVALLQRLYEPDSGFILIDGEQLSETDVHHLRSQIALVAQTPTLFNASVADNIAYGRIGKVSQKQIEAAAQKANVHNFILSLPEGYATNLGENAGLVSGGQAQRIAIARAVIETRPILILDECTSALDPENQRSIMESIRSIKQGRTTVVVTHKLDMMRLCDRLLVVKDGQVVEQGTFDALSAKPNGVFKELASAGEWLV